MTSGIQKPGGKTITLLFLQTLLNWGVFLFECVKVYGKDENKLLFACGLIKNSRNLLYQNVTNKYYEITTF